jgi:hypothetical protein
LGIDVYEQEEKIIFHDLSEIVIGDDVIMMLLGAFQCAHYGTPGIFNR